MWGVCASPPTTTAIAAAPHLHLPQLTILPLRSPFGSAATRRPCCRSPLAKGLPGSTRLYPSAGRSSLASRSTDEQRPRRLRAFCGGAGMLPPWWRDTGVTALVMAGAYGLVLVFDVLTQRDLLDQKLSRKLVHVLSGILFMSSWSIFSSSFEARFFAAVVPFANGLRLAIYGLSFATDEGLIKSVTREGKPEELLRGPLYFVIVLMFCCLVFWRDSPVGLITLSMMSGGDGIADIMGRKFGGIKLPYNKQKSWVGSICMFLFGSFLSMGMIYFFSSLGYFSLDFVRAAQKVLAVSLVATLVESLPISNVDDNLSVPLASMLLSALLFGF